MFCPFEVGVSFVPSGCGLVFCNILWQTQSIKSLCSDWLFFGQDFAVHTASMKTVQSVYFCFGAKPANSKFTIKTAKKKSVNIVILNIETTRRS